MSSSKGLEQNGIGSELNLAEAGKQLENLNMNRIRGEPPEIKGENPPSIDKGEHGLFYDY